MPRSLQDILDSADELARLVESTDVGSLEWQDAAPLQRIRAAVLARGEAERALSAAVVGAREAGLSWAAIGAYLGTSGEAARQRYGRAVSTEAAASKVVIEGSVRPRRSAKQAVAAKASKKVQGRRGAAPTSGANKNQKSS